MTKYAVSLPTQEIYNKYMKWATKDRGWVHSGAKTRNPTKNVLAPWNSERRYITYWDEYIYIGTDSISSFWYQGISAQEAMGDIDFKVGMKLRLLEDYNKDLSAGDTYHISNYTSLDYFADYKWWYEIIKEEISWPIWDPRDYKTDWQASEKTLNNMIKSMEPQYKTGDWVKQYKHPKLWRVANRFETDFVEWYKISSKDWLLLFWDHHCAEIDLPALWFEPYQEPEIPEWIEDCRELFEAYRKNSVIQSDPKEYERLVKKTILNSLPPSPKITIEEIKNYLNAIDLLYNIINHPYNETVSRSYQSKQIFSLYRSTARVHAQQRYKHKTHNTNRVPTTRR